MRNEYVGGQINTNEGQGIQKEAATDNHRILVVAVVWKKGESIIIGDISLAQSRSEITVDQTSVVHRHLDPVPLEVIASHLEE